MDQYEKHMQALESIAGQLKDDPNVIALLLVGSLSYATVWEKSDIDLELIVRDTTKAEEIDRKIDYCLEEDGVEIHLALTSVSGVKAHMRSLRGGEGSHSYFGLGRFVFTKDESLREFFEEMKTVGEADAKLSFIDLAEDVIVCMQKAEKWVRVYHDPLYAQRFLVGASWNVAAMILLYHREDPSREAILRAMELEPEVMTPIYIPPMTTKMSEAQVLDTVERLDSFLSSHIDWWSEPVLRCLSDGEPKRTSQIMKLLGVENMFYPLAYLAQKGKLLRVTQSARLFKHSKTTVEEVAYMLVKEDAYV